MNLMITSNQKDKVRRLYERAVRLLYELYGTFDLRTAPEEEKKLMHAIEDAVDSLHRAADF